MHSQFFCVQHWKIGSALGQGYSFHGFESHRCMPNQLYMWKMDPLKIFCYNIMVNYTYLIISFLYTYRVWSLFDELRCVIVTDVHTSLGREHCSIKYMYNMSIIIKMNYVAQLHYLVQENLIIITIIVLLQIIFLGAGILAMIKTFTWSSYIQV